MKHHFPLSREILLDRNKNVFTYNGCHFEPVIAFNEIQNSFAYVAKHIYVETELAMSAGTEEWKKRPWNYTSFMEASTDKHANVFYCYETGLLYMPAETMLFGWNEDKLNIQEVKCENCGYLYAGIVISDELGHHSSCPDCNASFDVNNQKNFYSVPTGWSVISVEKFIKKLKEIPLNISLDFTFDTADDVEMNFEPSGWYGMRKVNLFDSSSNYTLCFGSWGSDFVEFVTITPETNVAEVIISLLKNETGADVKELCISDCYNGK